VVNEWKSQKEHMTKINLTLEILLGGKLQKWLEPRPVVNEKNASVAGNAKNVVLPIPLRCETKKHLL